MLPSSRELILNSPVLRTFYDHNKEMLIAFTDKKDLIFIDLNKLKISKSISLSHNNTGEFDYYHRPVAIKNNNVYVKLSVDGKEYILNIKDKINKETIFDYNHNSKITKAHFSEDSKYLIIGNEKGRTYLVDTHDGSLVNEFPHFTDSVSAVAISPQNKYVISTSFSNEISILDVNFLSLTQTLKIDYVIEMIQFVDDDIFLAITREGRVLKISAKTQKIIQEISLSDSVWPSELCISDSKKFVYIGTRESVIYALHVNTLDIVFSISLNKSGITSLIRTPKYFVVGFKTGEIQFFNHREFEDNFVLNVQLKKLQKATELFNKNIFLMTHRATNDIYNTWLTQKDNIIQLISNGEINEAQKLASIFLFHPKCKMEMTSIEELEPNLIILQRYIRSAAYNAAYELIERNPELKATILYEKLEDIWKKSLQKAQLLLSREPILNRDLAREKLNAFIQVEIKKDFIENMINNSNVFTRAEMAVKNKNFNLYFKLAKDNDFLKFTQLYKKVLGLAETIKQNIFNCLKTNNYILALENVKLLNQFLPYSSYANSLEDFINALILIEYHTNNKNLFEAISIQNKIQIQSNYEPIQKLETMKRIFFKNLLAKINDGDISDIFEKIKYYLPIEICKKETSRIMKNLYVAQMKKILTQSQKSVDWVKTLENYSQYFNFDKLVFDFYKELNINEPIDKLVKVKDEKRSDFSKSIIIYK